MNELLGLAGEVVLVTGAGSGIGKATALLYARAGARVACCGIVEADEAATAAEIRAAGGEAIHLVADMRDRAEVFAMVAAVEARLGPLAVAVNVVGGLGGQKPRPFLDLTDEDWDIPIRNNLTTTMLCCQAEALAMARAGTPGRIVTFSSGAGMKASPTMAHYGAAKAAVIQLTKTLAIELAPHGIRVNCVVPGTHLTPSLARQIADPANPGMADFVARSSAAIPLGRLGEVEETAGAALFLGSKLSGFMTGHTVISDGGALHATPRGAASQGLAVAALKGG
ncbi:SDR family NAD(P)-dependent oxidoreductase [Novosphingobium bradum]|uniref:SDR family NAD(P)-dependent oxidoreductase n=1 Tax=Novosphingobium bradum TaxID=1737444 RepID=A0ABV7IUK9_9SPHN